eukprot:1644937-Rhodomonas_salina.1
MLARGPQSLSRRDGVLGQCLYLAEKVFQDRIKAQMFITSCTAGAHAGSVYPEGSVVQDKSAHRA